MRKGERSTGTWIRTRRRLVAAVAVALASVAIPCAAQKKLAVPATPAPAAADPAVKGAIVSYEELKQSSIVYLEESGGMTLGTTAPVAPERGETPKAASAEPKSPEERAISTTTGTSTSLRRAPQRSGAGVTK